LIQVSWLALPYFAVSRSLGTPAERNYMFQAILIVAVILCCATIYTQIVGWHYLSFTEIGGQYSTERRFGLIRTGATLASGMFGLLCCFALMLLISRRDLVRNSFSRIFGALLFFVGILASGARGAMVSGVIATCVWLAARRLTVGMVWVSAVTLVVGLPVLIDTMTSAELTILGNQDTISYRQQLLVAAMQQFAEAPLFGDRNFIRSPHLAHLVQGQQIIDIVNSYLQMLLAYGIVGLALFALAAFYVARGVVRKLSSRQCDALEASDLALMLGFLAGYLSLISTTSQTSYLAFFGAMLLGLGRAAGATDAERALAGRGRSAA
jgi:O-antigen ligase